MDVMRFGAAGLPFFLLAVAASPDVTHDRHQIEARAVRELREFKIEADLQGTPAHLGEDGTYVAGYTPGGVAIFNSLTGRKISEISTDGRHPHDGAISPDGRFYALSFDTRDVRVHELATGKKISEFQVDSAYS
jgi:hypothetical protein